MSGYSSRELEDIQAKWQLRFPPDLLAIYGKRRSVIPGGFDWIRTTGSEIQRMVDWPLEGFLFDMRENEFWLDEWGEKPSRETEAVEKVRAFFGTIPKLIPIYGHRYLPETPNAAGNPVFSVYQTDVVYYGVNLKDYVARETHRGAPEMSEPKRIPFWSMFVEQAASVDD